MVNISKKVINIEAWKNFFKALFKFLLILIYTTLRYFVSWAGTSSVVWLIFWLFRITITTKEIENTFAMQTHLKKFMNVHLTG